MPTQTFLPVAAMMVFFMMMASIQMDGMMMRVNGLVRAARYRD